ncbi:hypothetical protein BDR26DRAFT_875123 [Obelidium mucronatum]|nr:hypothetical protein BDR26DRAFT_875123 [Obelidium mucronatum]
MLSSKLNGRSQFICHLCHTGSLLTSVTLIFPFHHTYLHFLGWNLTLLTTVWFFAWITSSHLGTTGIQASINSTHTNCAAISRNQFRSGQTESYVNLPLAIDCLKTMESNEKRYDKKDFWDLFSAWFADMNSWDVEEKKNYAATVKLDYETGWGPAGAANDEEDEVVAQYAWTLCGISGKRRCY